MMKSCTIFALLAACLLCGVFSPAYASVAVIVHPDNDSTLNERQLRNIYLGKSRVFPNGNEATALDLSEGQARRQFIAKVLKRSEANLNSYWARMLFSSQGQPPRELDSEKAVKQAVAENRSAIGYIDADQVDESVRVLMTLE